MLPSSWTTTGVGTRNDLDSLLVQQLVLEGVGKATHQRASHSTLDRWDCLGVSLDDFNKYLIEKAGKEVDESRALG